MASSTYQEFLAAPDLNAQSARFESDTRVFVVAEGRLLLVDLTTGEEQILDFNGVPNSVNYHAGRRQLAIGRARHESNLWIARLDPTP